MSFLQKMATSSPPDEKLAPLFRMTSNLKTCSTCSIELPIQSFPSSGNGRTRPQCKTCLSATRKKLRALMTEKVCKICEKKLPMEDYDKNGRGGRHSRCSKCRSHSRRQKNPSARKKTSGSVVERLKVFTHDGVEYYRAYVYLMSCKGGLRVGSTTDLKSRKMMYKNEIQRSMSEPYIHLRNEGVAFEDINFKILRAGWYRSWPDRLQLRREEQYFIDLYKPKLNLVRAWTPKITMIPEFPFLFMNKIFVGFDKQEAHLAARIAKYTQSPWRLAPAWVGTRIAALENQVSVLQQKKHAIQRDSDGWTRPKKPSTTKLVITGGKILKMTSHTPLKVCSPSVEGG